MEDSLDSEMELLESQNAKSPSHLSLPPRAPPSRRRLQSSNSEASRLSSLPSFVSGEEDDENVNDSLEELWEQEREQLLEEIERLRSALANFQEQDDGDNETEQLMRNSEDLKDHSPPAFLVCLADRTGWLTGLLVLQSVSSFIIARHQDYLSHGVIVQFLTMLVGAGGNAGNQTAVQAIRALAVGQLHDLRSYWTKECLLGLATALVLGVVGYIRAAAFGVSFAECVAISTSLICIVFTSTVLGSALPSFLRYIELDPAHASTTIQVIMDIVGVSITMQVCHLVLGKE